MCHRERNSRGLGGYRRGRGHTPGLREKLVAALKDDDVRDMALRAAGLSERSLRAIRDMIESARAVEGLAAEDHRARSSDGG